MAITADQGPMMVTTAGVGGTLLGSLRLTDGDIKGGAQDVFIGMTFANLGGRFQGLDSHSHSMLMKYTLGAGTGVVGVRGLVRLASGVKQKSVDEILKGGIQTIAGIGTAFVVSNLDARTLVVAHEASILALSSSCIAKQGAQDLVNGRYSRGLCKLLLSLGGIASAGYYVYSTCIHKDSLSADQIAFLEAHGAELEQIYENKIALGKWMKLGKGVSKTAFTHPDLPGMLIKIPNNDLGFRGKTGEDDLRMHYANFEKIRSIADSFDRIVLPQSHLYQTSKGLMIVEQRLDFAQLYTVSNGPEKQKAMDQFYAFRAAANLCDLDPEVNRNSGIVLSPAPLKIGIIDFDCRRSGLQWDWNFQNSRLQFLVPDNRNQNAALVLLAGAAIMAGVAAVSEKIAQIQPKKICQLGIGVGAATALFMSSQGDFAHPAAATMAGTGIAMAATAIIILITVEMYSWIEAGFMRLRG